jgi:hypothetical protein
MDIINIIVVNECMLCAMRGESNQAEILRGSILRGATRTDGIISINPKIDGVRVANVNDFDTYRVCINGYLQDKEVHFDKSN